MNLLDVNAQEFCEAGLMAHGVKEVKAYDKNRPDIPYADRPQEVKDGLKHWEIQVTFPGAFQPMRFGVRIWSATEPPVVPGAILFGGLSITMYEKRQGGLSVSVTADTFTQDPPPSVKRSAPPVPAGSAA